jgi:hypothetical protein
LAFRALPDGRNLPAMADGPKNPEKTRRERRLSAALRENLKRRKAQARGRSAGAPTETTGTPHDSAGIAGDKRSS